MQYGWTLFVNPMHDARHWEKAGIQLAFTIMIFVNTWLSPVEGWFVDRFGPRPVVMAGGLFTGLSWMLNARATSFDRTLYSRSYRGSWRVLRVWDLHGYSTRGSLDKIWRGTRRRHDCRRLRIGGGDYRDPRGWDDPFQRVSANVLHFRA